MKITLNVILTALCITLTLPVATPSRAETSPKAAPVTTKPNLTADDAVLGRVNGVAISAAEFEASVRDAARRKFYHGNPPADLVDTLMRETANELIERALLLEEVKRQGLKGDPKAVNERVADFEQRYGKSANMRENREEVLASLRARLSDDAALEVLEKKTRNVPAPGEEQVRAYYKKNPDKFTEPEKMKLSMILLNVAPSSTTEKWNEAEARVGALRLRILEGGADFATLAREHSEDQSAKAGGDLGYLHRGMIPEGIQSKVDTMKPGDISEPTRVLQGFALFRYDAYQPPKHHDFETVRPRATDLLERDLADQAWERLAKRLRGNAQIELNVARYPALSSLVPAKKR